MKQFLRTMKLLTGDKLEHLRDRVMEEIRDKQITTIGIDLTGSQQSGGFSWNVAIVPEFMEYYDEDSGNLYEEAMHHFWEMDMTEEEAEEAYNNSDWNMHVIPYWENEGQVIESENNYDYNTDVYINNPDILLQDMALDYIAYASYFMKLELGLDIE